MQWRKAAAESLPFEPDSFDAVVSQFGLMFFADPKAAIMEMSRVLRPKGRLAIAVWSSLEDSVGYSAVTELLARLYGEAVANLVRAPFSLGDAAMLEDLMKDSGFSSPTVERVSGQAQFPSIRGWMHTEIRGWTLADELNDAQFETLVEHAEHDLRNLAGHDGSVRFEQPALLVSAAKP